MRRPAAAIAAVIVPLALAAPASAAQRTLTTSFGPGGPVEIAMDGSRVAVVDEFGPCTARVRIANVVTGAVRALRTARPCPGGEQLNREGGGPLLALAGSNVLLTESDEAHQHYPRLLAGSPGRPLRVVESEDGADRDAGPFLGAVVGSGTLRAYATWTRAWLPSGCDPAVDTCTLDAPAGFVRAFPSEGAIASLSGALIPTQMEGQLIALRGTNGDVRVLGTDGVTRADLPAASARSAAVVGGRLATLRRGAAILDVWNSSTGAVVRAIPLAAGATGRIDAARVHGDAWVVYRTARAVRAVRLRDARDVLVAGYTTRRVTDVQIETPGVTWTWTRGPVRRPTAAGLRFATLPDPA